MSRDDDTLSVPGLRHGVLASKGGKEIMKNKLKEARFFANKPQIQLYLDTGIHYSTLSRFECGYLDPSKEQREKLAVALDVSEEWLFPEVKS